VKCDPNQHHRRSVRLEGYDYAQMGVYFITICTHKKICLFGGVVDEKMVLNDAGRIAEECWASIPMHFPESALDEYVIMPNHIHGILAITDPLSTDAETPSPPHGVAMALGSIIRGFKIGVTKWLRRNTSVYNVWQRSYYEHIVRNETELNALREYVITNPRGWALDRENTED
jgi:REP-associated tyrosine transposase